MHDIIMRLPGIKLAARNLLVQNQIIAFGIFVTEQTPGTVRTWDIAHATVFG